LTTRSRGEIVRPSRRSHGDRKGPPALLALLATVGTSHAQIADHLKCYKIKDPLKIIGSVDLNTPQLGLDPGCRITSAKLF
jgi:hypothetical protein